jgi:uncharacterized membrane protein
MRTFSTPSALVVRGDLTGVPRAVILLAAAGEVLGDKLPQAPARTAPAPLGGRIAAGALCGALLAGRAGAASGAAAAFAGSFACMHARKLIVDATGLPDPVVAVGEDVLAYTLAAIATRDR